MTCVVSWITTKNGKTTIHMGADSLASNGWRKTHLKETKVFCLENKMLIGLAGCPRVKQVLECQLKLPAHPAGMDPRTYLVTLFIPEMRALLKANGASHVLNELDTMRGSSTLMVGYMGRVFTVEANYQLIESQEVFDAIGSGYEFALGACAVLSSSTMKPDRKVGTAIEVAKVFDPGVGGEVIVWKL